MHEPHTAIELAEHALKLRNWYVFVGLHPRSFEHLFKLSDSELAAQGIDTAIADDDYPCRIALAAPPAGTRMLLLNHPHQTHHSPYAASGPIFIAQTSNRFRYVIGRVPPVIASRLLSLRGYDRNHRIVDALVCEGSQGDFEIRRMFSDRTVHYIHAHFAKRGCFAAKVVRLEDLPAELVAPY